MSPSPFAGNLGDEAKMIGACTYLQNESFRVGILIDENAEQPTYLNRFDNIVPLAGAYTRLLETSKTFVEILQQWSAFGVFGADVIDGTYNEERALGMLSRLYEAQCMEVSAQLLGSCVKSLNINLLVRNTLNAIGEGGLAFRDEVSSKRVQNVTGMRAKVVADAAFLLPGEPSEYGERVGRRIQNLRNSGYVI